MADDGTVLYVKTDGGSVAVIDPAKSVEVRRLALGPGGLCQGIGAGRGAVWSCDPNPSGATDDVLRVNPKSGEVRSFAVGKRPDQGHLDVAADPVWVITDAGLAGLDGRTGRSDPPIDLGVPGTDLAAAEGRAYVVSRGAGAVVGVDLAERRVVAQSAVPDARAVAVSDEVWVVTGSELVALEKQRLEETARIPIEGAPCSVAAKNESVFVGSTQPLLTEVDATSHRIRRVVVTDVNSQCGDLHVAFGAVWSSANEGDVVHRLPL
jgi:streptogramin lyase